jgi:murein tripeptide amidase MpaA
MLKYKSAYAVKVKLTQRAIKHVLTERWYAWEDARLLAESDGTVNLYPTDGEPSYTPGEVQFMVSHAAHQYTDTN